MARLCSSCRSGEMLPDGAITQNVEREGWNLPLKCSNCGSQRTYFESDSWCE